MHPERIKWMLGTGALREFKFQESDVVGFWNKAVAQFHDAKVRGRSFDGAISSAYTAVFEACLALLAHQNLRFGSARNHHENAFAGIAALDLPGLDDLIPESARIRSLRHSAMYDPEVAAESERDDALKWMEATLPKMYAALVQWDPTLTPKLTAP